MFSSSELTNSASDCFLNYYKKITCFEKKFEKFVGQVIFLAIGQTYV